MGAWMGRVKQSISKRGSLKWIQKAINQKPPRKLDDLILPKLNRAKRVTWSSPLSSDDYAEYTDGDFLCKVGEPNMRSELETFWPNGGPHWDALGRSDTGDIILVEAKAHIAELCSSPSEARLASRKIIQAALSETVSHLGAKPRAEWTEVFYQLTNRLAHPHFLRKHGLKAWLILLNVYRRFRNARSVQATRMGGGIQSRLACAWN